jgi:hypothetical protein
MTECLVLLRSMQGKPLAPPLRPVFGWNHHVVMGWGYEDLKTRLMKTAH